MLEASATNSNNKDFYSTKLKGDQDWHDYRIDFISEKQFAGLQFLLSEKTEIRNIEIYRNGLPQKLTFENALATFSQNGYPVATAIDGKVAPAGNGWAISPQMGKDHYASFQVKSPSSFEGPTDLQIILKQEFQSGQHSLGRFRVAVTDLAKPISYGLPEEVVQIFGVAPDKRSPEQNKIISDAFKKSDPERVALNNAVTEASKPLPKDPNLTELETSSVQCGKAFASTP